VNPLTQSKYITILPVLITMTLTCLMLASGAHAACQEGCLTNQNTVLGDDALVNNVSGVANTAVGGIALEFNTEGGYNTAIGFGALQFNETGIENTAIGYGALPNNTNGQYNTASGRSALYYNTTGSNNTASGYRALETNTTGKFNTAIGGGALVSNVTGNNNIAMGFQAGARIRGHNNIAIGNQGAARDSGAIRLGTTGTHTNAYIAGISGVTVPTGVPVIVDADGHLGTTTSSARYKEAIKPMDKASEAILALKPVTFRYKQELDPEGIPQFGLVAEEVEKVNPDLVARDDQGKPYTVRYEAVNAMLLNEFLKEHRTVQEQQAIISQLKSAVAKQNATAGQQQKQIEALTAGLQKVSAQLELSKAAPRTVLNDH
jgi:trimeric autotransporter adhesin